MFWRLFFIFFVITPGLSSCAAVIWRDSSAPAEDGSMPNVRAAASAGISGTGQTDPAKGTDRAPANEPGKLAPVDLEVAEAFFEEDVLLVKIRVRAKTSINPQNIAVGVLGLREGDVVEKNVQAVSDIVVGREMIAGQSAALSFSLREPELTEYQVQCSWGEDAARLLSEAPARPRADASADSRSSAPSAGIRAESASKPLPDEHPLGLEDVNVEENKVDCAAAPCDILYTMNGRLVNHLPDAVSRIQLAVGLYWTMQGMLPQVPASGAAPTSGEEIIDLGAAVLPGGASRRIRINIDRKIPVVPGGRFVPHLRVVGFLPEGQ